MAVFLNANRHLHLDVRGGVDAASLLQLFSPATPSKVSSALLASFVAGAPQPPSSTMLAFLSAYTADPPAAVTCSAVGVDVARVAVPSGVLIMVDETAPTTAETLWFLSRVAAPARGVTGRVVASTSIGRMHAVWLSPVDIVSSATLLDAVVVGTVDVTLQLPASVDKSKLAVAFSAAGLLQMTAHVEDALSALGVQAVCVVRGSAVEASLSRLLDVARTHGAVSVQVGSCTSLRLV
jgi:hypothetical protein